MLSPTGPGGVPRSLTWRDLKGVSAALAAEIGLPDALWVTVPCTIATSAISPPEADILSSFFLPDLGRVLHEIDRLPEAAAAYLGLRPPAEPWDALGDDRRKLSALIQPGLFPLGHWPEPGLHSLNLLQQAAVNAIVRDVADGGLASVNGPPGTGKTTLLRDVAAHVLVARADALVRLGDPRTGLNEWLDLAAWPCRRCSHPG